MGIVVGVGVVVERDGKVLLGQKRDGIWDGHWSLPGGKIEPFESIENCGCRELQEETGLEAASKPKIISVNTDVDVERNFHSITFGVSLRDFRGEVLNKEPHKFNRWEWLDIYQLPAKLFLPSISVLAAYLAKSSISDIRTSIAEHAKLLSKIRLVEDEKL